MLCLEKDVTERHRVAEWVEGVARVSAPARGLAAWEVPLLPVPRVFAFVRSAAASFPTKEVSLVP
ncbi:MAG: hypothetical protein JXK94_00520 [Deltaproteobacteria bacterium]|nr:hypothetical protein [Deltaproteobacteria bacterium]